MRVSAEELRQIIKEELEAVLDEKKGKKTKASKKKKRKKKKKKKAAKKDACYHKVKSRYKVWPSAYASGALVKCRKVGAKNWGNSTKEGLNEEFEKHQMYDPKTGSSYTANTQQDHVEMAAKGYVHVDPKKIRDILDDEGGAAGLDPLIKGTESSEEEVEQTLILMPDIGQHEEGDYIKDDDQQIDVVKEDELSEKKLTNRDKKQKEKYVKGMKDQKSDFKKRYGKDAESVMYATATQMAKKKK